MAQFAAAYPTTEFAKQPVSQIPWGHNILLLQKVKNFDERLWYSRMVIENGWSRSLLLHWVESGLYQRQGQAVTNFTRTLPQPQSDLAAQTLKDPYCFDFLVLREQHDEKELEEGLVRHIQSFLLELGVGFAFLGRQYRIEVEEEDYYLDLLFYPLISVAMWLSN